MLDLKKALQNGTLQKMAAHEYLTILEKASVEIERLEAERKRWHERYNELWGLLMECADELEAYIRHHYDRTLDYPSQRVKFEGEMSLVEKARAAAIRKG